ncbi:MAG: DEAD/DEAH box helicase, partial [Lachnospiraceae bacterium]|nr:DEAD/DEAH box helicase [Lachnospiraceae bacterium]
MSVFYDYLDPRILRAIGEMGYEEMTPIQEQAIPVMREGRDMIGQAQTGTGKTAAFGLPLLEKIDPASRDPQAFIICPTRELAVQAAGEMQKFAKYMEGIRVLAVYGGQDISRQIRALKGGVQVIVGTPGRVMDHMRRRTIRTDHVKIVIMDEADEMLDMGFREDMET